MHQNTLISSSWGQNYDQSLRPFLKHQRQRKRHDWIKFFVLALIFLVMTYMFLTFVQGVFDHSLKI